MTEITGPGHFLVFGGLVSFEVMDPAKGFAGTEFAAELEGVGRRGTREQVAELDDDEPDDPLLEDRSDEADDSDSIG
ncbi:hypothetical protein BGX30_014267 [Mortierella sp. GBA39]|nr:hypothetical protein BGX30_014267 [Mortierella sp. GBA39]